MLLLHLVRQFGAPAGTRVRVGDGFQLAPVQDVHRAFEPHPAVFRGRPGQQDGRVERGRTHDVVTQAIGLAQHHGHHRRCGIDDGRHQPRAVAHQAGGLGLRPHHQAGCVGQHQQGDVEGVADRHEACRLDGTVAVDRSGQVGRLVGQHAHAAPADAYQRGDDAGAEDRAQLHHAIGVGQDLDHAAYVIGLARVLGDDVAQRRLVMLAAGRAGWAEIRKVSARSLDGGAIVVDYQVVDARLLVHVSRPNVGRAQAQAERGLHQWRTAHAECASFEADQKVAHAGQVGVAGEGIAGHHADRRHQARQFAENGEAGGLAAGRQEQVLRARATAVEPHHHRIAVTLRVFQHAREL